MLESILNFLENTGVYRLFSSIDIGTLKTVIMFIIAGVLIYLAIGK